MKRAPLNLTRCPAPTSTAGGTIRCVTSRPCREHTGHHWSLLLLPAALVWAFRPWWPNELGRLQDRGRAHTSNVSPCRYCVHLRNEVGVPVGEARALHAAATRGGA